VVEPNFQMFIKYFLTFLHFSLYWSKPKGNFQLGNSLLCCIIKKQKLSFAWVYFVNSKGTKEQSEGTISFHTILTISRVKKKNIILQKTYTVVAVTKIEF
jgi:hypothetical protein